MARYKVQKTADKVAGLLVRYPRFASSLYAICGNGYTVDASGDIQITSPTRVELNRRDRYIPLPSRCHFYIEVDGKVPNKKRIFQQAVSNGKLYWIDYGSGVMEQGIGSDEPYSVFESVVIPNSEPNTPSTINLPSTVKGGESCSVSWSASTDPDGNLEGYIVERSYNGGSSWSQIYQGSSTSTSTTIPHGTSTVMFRVCAYDTDGERSGWQTSANKTVLNNRAPNTPSAINVPVSPSGGESVTVTWSAASDPDGNLEGYRLERQWDGKGAFDQVYQGSALSYTDTIPKGEHTSVTYRVRAYDAFGATSGYTTSPARTISNNTAPLIQCDLSGDLGDKSEGFTIPYTVTDAENHAVTVTEKVGGMVKRSNHSVTLGQPNTFQITGAYFQKVRNGKQTAEIIATDAEGKSSTLSLTFTKKVHRASIMLSEPLAVEKEIKVCIIKVLGDIPADATFKVEVANNAGDDAPAWEDATDASKRGINYVFKNKTQVNGWKFGFRVTAERGKSGNGGYITSVQGGFQ